MPRGPRYPVVTGATINLYNLAKKGVPFRPGRTLGPIVYRDKVAFLVDSLLRMDCPDFFVVEELFHRDPLEEVLSQIEAYHGAQIIMPPEAEFEPRVAIVSRLPVLEQSIHFEFPEGAVFAFEDVKSPVTSFRRPVVQAVLQVPDGPPLVVFGFHLKSQLPIFEEGESKSDLEVVDLARARASFVRNCEARALRTLGVRDLKENDRPLLIAGDANTDAASDLVRAILGEHPWPGAAKEEADAIYAAKLWDIGEFFIQQSRYGGTFTHHYNGQFARFDIAAGSTHLYPFSPKRIGRFEDYWVFADHLCGAARARRANPVSLKKSDHGFVWFKLGFDMMEKWSG